MKLATKYQRSNLIATVVLFLIASAAFYLLLHRVLIFQMDEDLEIEQHEIETYAHKFGAMPQNVMMVEDQIVKVELASTPMDKAIHHTVVLRDEVEHSEDKFRQLVFTVQTGSQLYQVSVSKFLEATQGLANLIILIALGTIALMLVVSFLINRMVLRRLWKPFYKTIARMQAFELSKTTEEPLPFVPIEEFDLLNKTLEAATSRASQDYQVLKEFTENASHELQTPLAIVRSKLDLLIQDERMSEEQSRIILDTYEAVRRMTHLNQSLLMLAKIEGGQYAERTSVDVRALLEEKLTLFESFIQDRGITFERNLAPSGLLANPALMDMLLNNLLSNAINHSNQNGRVDVALTADGLVICNTSDNMPLKHSALFTRFYKTTSGATRTGLGLAITIRQRNYIALRWTGRLCGS